MLRVVGHLLAVGYIVCRKLRVSGCIRKQSLLFYFIFVMTAIYFSVTCSYTVFYCENIFSLIGTCFQITLIIVHCLNLLG